VYQLAFAVRTYEAPTEVSDLFDLANELELQVGEWVEAHSGIQATLSAVTALYPESLAYDK
jgi:hypothetical protein